MELRVKPHDKNSFPLGGILIKGSSVEQWLKEIQWMGLSFSAIAVYPIPHTTANTIWGCLVDCNIEKNKTDIGRNAYCQVVNNILFIPERSMLYPKLSDLEVEKLFGSKKHILHPEFGLVELEEQIEWKSVIEMPAMRLHEIKEPASSVFIPMEIKTFQIKALAVEEALETFEEKHFPKQEKFKDKPLNPFEGVRLFLYKQLFTKKRTDENPDKTGVEKTSLLSKLESIRKLFSKKNSNWADDMQTDYEELERRNQKHLDRLLDLLKKNPEEALKYAIPLDMDGTARGSGKASFGMQKRWLNFSLFGGAFNQSSGSGSALLPGNAFNRLHEQYLNTAQELMKQKDYKKAAFVYMKLLKNYPMAAQALETGGFYQEAASVYLKYCNNKLKAAECFEKGSMTANAIELYKELDNDEKVGDLYYSIHKKKDAFIYYQKVVDTYTQSLQYVKASLLYKNKMENEAAGQELLLEGWRSNKDAVNCLNNYFSNIRDIKQLGNELQAIYHKDVHATNRETYLQVLKYEYDKQNELSEAIKDMAHEIIVEQIAINPSVVSELRAFNKEDKQLIKDTMRFKVKFPGTGP